MFRRFPKVDVVAIDGSFGDEPCAQFAANVRKQNENIPIVAFLPNVGARCKWADETTSSHDPAGLLELLEKMGGRTDI